jgi:CDP-diacylglycerol---serine O-phosphatidyltransferase
VVAAPLTLLTALSMVTSIRYNSFKKVEGGPVRFLTFATVVGLLALATVDPPRILFLVAFVYVLSGPIAALLRRSRRSTSA